MWSISHLRGFASAVYGTTASPLWFKLRGPCSLAGNPLLDCIPAGLSEVASIALGDVLHGFRCSLARLRSAVLGYRPCCLPGRSPWSPQCV